MTCPDADFWRWLTNALFEGYTNLGAVADECTIRLEELKHEYDRANPSA